MYINAKRKSTQKEHTLLKTVYDISSGTDKALSKSCTVPTKIKVRFPPHTESYGSIGAV